MLESQRVSSPANQIESSESPLSQPPALESPNTNLTPNGTVTGMCISVWKNTRLADYIYISIGIIEPILVILKIKYCLCRC